MGCTTSMSQRPQFDKEPLACSNVLEVSSDSHTDISIAGISNNNNKLITDNGQMVEDKGSGKTSTNNGNNNTQFNRAHLVILSQDNEISDTATADTDKVVPSFIHSDHHDGLQHMHTMSSRTSSTDSQHYFGNKDRQKRQQCLPGGIKSVLKTGRHTGTDDPRNDMLANRPIKTVTFVDSVTVVTVF